MSNKHTQRLDHFSVAPDLFKPMLEQEALLKESDLDHCLIGLVKLRASQINGCAFCINMHWQDARAHGEREERLYLLNAWRDASVYSPRERAALAWTEALTRIETTQAPDEDYAVLNAQFTAKEQVALSLLICAINSWNRIAVGFRMPHGVPQEENTA